MFKQPRDTHRPGAQRVWVSPPVTWVERAVETQARLTAPHSVLTHHTLSGPSSRADARSSTPRLGWDPICAGLLPHRAPLQLQAEAHRPGDRQRQPRRLGGQPATLPRLGDEELAWGQNLTLIHGSPCPLLLTGHADPRRGAVSGRPQHWHLCKEAQAGERLRRLPSFTGPPVAPEAKLRATDLNPRPHLPPAWTLPTPHPLKKSHGKPAPLLPTGTKL